VALFDTSHFSAKIGEAPIQVKILFDFARALGVVFSLTGIAVIILVLDRLSFTKAAYRMASFIRKGEG